MPETGKRPLFIRYDRIPWRITRRQFRTGIEGTGGIHAQRAKYARGNGIVVTLSACIFDDGAERCVANVRITDSGAGLGMKIGTRQVASQRCPVREFGIEPVVEISLAVESG